MENTLHPNDYVLINKITYGTKIPNRIQDITVIGNFFEKEGALSEYNLYKSLKPLKPFKREDVIVFKSTEDNSTYLVKRIIGKPGDTLKIVDSHVYINKKKVEEKDAYCYNYINTHTNGLLEIETLSNKEFKSLKIRHRNKLKKQIHDTPNKDNYEELIIPKKGFKILIDKNNISIYKNSIYNLEQNHVVFNAQSLPMTYTFKNNYFFVMGDNRHNSLDSREFGLVPENYIQGKMIYILSIAS